MNAGGIYAIVNLKNNNMYIGSTTVFKKRWGTHRRSLENGIHYNKYLQSAFQKHGKEIFQFNVIEYVDENTKLLEREQVWIDFFKPKYNMAKVAGRPCLGKRASPETRAKMSAARKGKPAPFVWTKEMREKASEARKGLKPNLSDAERLRRKLVMLGNKIGVGLTNKAHKGRIFSDEHRKKLSLANLSLPKSAYDSRRGPRKKKG